MATVACKCGEKFHPSPEHFGKEVKCRRCGRMVKLVPDPALDPPPKQKSAPFTQSFAQNAPPPPSYAQPVAPQEPPPLDPNAPPPGLHPEVRRILMYAAVVFAVIAVGLIASSFKGAPPPVEQVDPNNM